MTREIEGATTAYAPEASPGQLSTVSERKNQMKSKNATPCDISQLTRGSYTRTAWPLLLGLLAVLFAGHAALPRISICVATVRCTRAAR